MTLGVADILIALLLVGWFVLSILNQFGFEWFDKVRRHDHFSLLPLWTFFAPNPGQSDYHLIYRDRKTDGSVTEWREIDITERRKPYGFIWNPEKRSKKVLSDLVSSMLSSLPDIDQSDRIVMLSIPYLILLNVVSHVDAEDQTTYRQFVLVETFGFNPTNEPRVVLRSDFHLIPAERPV